MEEFSMTITEMYQEIVEQEMADIFLDSDSLIVDDYALEDVIEEIRYLKCLLYSAWDSIVSKTHFTGGMRMKCLRSGLN
jgi:hypothetical protein